MQLLKRSTGPTMSLYAIADIFVDTIRRLDLH